MGKGTVIRPGEVQRMSAGRGVMDREFNGSQNDPVHFLQILVMPDLTGIRPKYEQEYLGDEEKRDRFRPVASNDGREGSVSIHQAAALYGSLLGPGRAVSHVFAPGRLGYAHLIRGDVRANDLRLAIGDNAKLREELRIGIQANGEAEFLLFELPGA